MQGDLPPSSSVVGVRLAAAAAANPDRAAVRAELAAMAAEPESDEPVSPTHAIDFHDAVARAAGNPALSLIAQVLSYVVADLYWAATNVAAPARLVRHDHHDIAEAILAGDAQLAYRRMADHARNTSGGILERVGHSRDDRFVLPPRRVGAAPYRQRTLVRGAYASADGSAK